MILNKQRQPLGTRAKWNWTWQVHAYERRAGNASRLHEIFLWGHGTEEREKEDSSSRPGKASNFRATGRVPTGGTSRFIVNNINQQQPTRVYGTLNTCLELCWDPMRERSWETNSNCTKLTLKLRTQKCRKTSSSMRPHGTAQQIMSAFYHGKLCSKYRQQFKCN